MAVKKVQRSSPGDDVTALLQVVNQLSAKFAALLDKLDADAGVTDADYGTVIGDPDTIDTVVQII